MPAVPRLRPLACLLALALALPSAAFAQGAGDDQYQDPFGDERTAQQDEDGGLSDEPPTTGGADGDPGPGGGTTGSGGDRGGGQGDTPSARAPRNALPNTGADPRPLVLVGLALVLLGLGLRLRTIDPDAF